LLSEGRNADAEPLLTAAVMIYRASGAHEDAAEVERDLASIGL